MKRTTKDVRKLHLLKLFAGDATRGERMTAEAVGIYLDYSKNRTTGETLKRKALAQRIIPELESKAVPELKHDSSTNTLIRRYRKLREAS
jgi:hypothetical protein